MTDESIKRERAVLALIWTDMVLHRHITEATFHMLMKNFSPHFEAKLLRKTEQEDRIIGYSLQVDDKDSIHMKLAIEHIDTSNKHLRLDVTSNAVKTFIEQSRQILLDYLTREFPHGEVKSSFAYEANKLIRQQTDEDGTD